MKFNVPIPDVTLKMRVYRRAVPESCYQCGAYDWTFIGDGSNDRVGAFEVYRCVCGHREHVLKHVKED